MSTKQLAQYTVDLKYSHLAKSTQESAKKCILDWLACCIRGSQEKPAVILQNWVQSIGGHHYSTIFTRQPWQAPSALAALANGAASHSLDNDDLHNASIIHLGTVVVPAALALAEQLGSSGRDLLCSVVAGYEVGARVGEAVNPDSYFFWHTTGTAGTFGSAAAAGKLLNLDVEQTVHCFGSAGTQAAGLWEFLRDGAMSKTLHAGKAALNGILAAQLAQQGFTGAQQILEGPKGFCFAMTDKADLSKLADQLTYDHFKIDDNSFKPYACCKHCHAAINAVLDLCRQHNLSYNDISSIQVKTNAVADNLVNNPCPENEYGCKFSLQYCAAAAARYHKVSVNEFLPDKATDKELRRIMKNVTIIVDPQLDEEYRRNPQKWSADVIIISLNGNTYRKFIEYPKGDPQNPFTYQEAEDKFRVLTHGIYPSEKVEQLITLIANLENLNTLTNAFAFLSLK